MLAGGLPPTTRSPAPRPPAGDAEVLNLAGRPQPLRPGRQAPTRGVTDPTVRDRFGAAVARFGTPASTLTDNPMVFTTRFAGGRARPQRLEAELRRRHVEQKHRRPNKPTTSRQGRTVPADPEAVARRPPHQPTNLVELQQLLDQFVAVYHQQRPHRSLPGRATPAVAYQARPQGHPATRHDHHDRVRHDRIDADGKVTLRSTAASPHRDRGEPTPEPPSCCSSTTATSASSTRPPASCCANCSSTPPATTSPPPTARQDNTTPNPR